MSSNYMVDPSPHFSGVLLMDDHPTEVSSEGLDNDKATRSLNGVLPPILKQGVTKDQRPLTPIKRAVKRHSKIRTSQGLRDRRVRLSIGIARKFFDLQDMLGFEKPSKTLEWLLTKSDMAINELKQMKHSCSSGLINPICEETLVTKIVKSKSGDQQRFTVKKRINGTSELRAKARARARERTKEKTCTGSLNIPSMKPILKDVREIEQENSEPIPDQATVTEVFEQSVLMKRKTKPSPNFCHQQNPVGYHNNINTYFISSTQNWNIGSSTAWSSLFASATGQQDYILVQRGLNH